MFKVRWSFNVAMTDDNGVERYGSLYFSGADEIHVATLRDASDVIEAISKRAQDFNNEGAEL
jgi:hypothetical protein